MAGADEEVEALCARIAPRLVGSLTLYCGDQRLAEELAQEALIRTWQRRTDVAAMASPEAWVFRTAVNLANSWFRRRRIEWRANQRWAATAPTWSPPPAAEAVALRDAVHALPARQRAVVVARFYLGFDVATTAEALGCRPGTVQTHTHRAMAHLRDRGGLADE
jgi:RNA polymerase sigma factor (sigma-70 family)